MITIAKIHTDFSSKFGIPRQSGLVPSLMAQIVFEPPFQNPDFILGIEEFSHLWLLWDFSLSHRENVSPTVYPPRLGGKEKRGVFATRSPFRPNSIALSCVKLEEVRYENNIPSLIVSGADILDGTPIYDIKPYLPYADCIPTATGGFAEEHKDDKIKVVFPPELLNILPPEKRMPAISLLSQDPRAAYNKKENFLYGMEFATFDIRFQVTDNTLTVFSVLPLKDNPEKIK